MAINLGSAFVDIVPSTQGLGASLRQQVDAPLARAGQNAGKSFGSQFTSGLASMAGSAARSLTNAVTGTVGAAAAVAGGTLATALFKGWDRVTTIEDATAALTISLGDAVKAGDLLGDVLGVVTGTPFALDQFSSAAQQLVGFGVEAGKVPGYLSAIGEASATQGKRAGEFAERLSTTFGQIAASGQVSLADVWSISKTGVNALAILANHFGLTRDAMKEMVSRGAVPAGEGLDALAKGIMEGSHGIAGTTVALEGTMEALGESLSGSSANFRTGLSRLGANIISPFAPALASAFSDATALLDGFGDKASAWGTRIVDSPGFNQLADWFADLPSKVGPGIDKLKELGPALAPLAAFVGAMALGGLAAALGPFGAIIPTISPVVAALGVFIATNDQMRDTFGRLSSALVDGAGQIWQALQPLGDQLLPLFADALGGLMDLAAQAAPVVAGFVSDGLEAISAWWDANGENVLDGFSSIGSTIGELARLVGGVAAVVWDKVLPALGDFAAWIFDNELAFETLKDAIGVGLVSALALYTLNVLAAGLATVIAFAPFLAFALVVGALAAATQFLADKFSGPLSDAVQWIIDRLGDLKDVVKGVVHWLELAVQLVEQLLDKLPDVKIPGGGGGIPRLDEIIGSLITGREYGGPVLAGQAYVVGEKRPEVFVPWTSGTILPEVPAVAPSVSRDSGSGVVIEVYNPVPEPAGESILAAGRRLAAMRAS